MTAVTSSGTRRGRRRSEAADDAILSAALELLAEKGYRGLTMAGVIERAAVSSATLYRRWTTKHELVAAAIASLAPAPVQTDTGSLAGDLDIFLRHYAHTLASREEFAESLLHEAPAEPEFERALREKFFHPRIMELRAILGRAQERGELAHPPSVDAAIALTLGPLYYRVFALREQISPAYLKSAVAYALAGLKELSG